MHHEQAARTKQGMEERIKELESMLKDMQSDFAQCAKGISPCFFCTNDDNCIGTSETCKFIWTKHN